MDIEKRKDGIIRTINRHRSEKIHMHQFFFAFGVFSSIDSLNEKIKLRHL